jgi:NADPH-dependent F420 reductase
MEGAMRIAMIGAGNVGRALGGALVRGGHEVVLSSARLEHTCSVAQEIGATAAGSNKDAVAAADVVVLAVPYDAIAAIIDGLGVTLDGKILIDVTNRREPQHIDGTSNAERTQTLAPRARVVKAFNTVFASRQADPVVDGVQLDGFVAADDVEARARVLELADSIGLRPIDAGPLIMARALEAMAILHISLNMRNGWPWQSGWKLVGPTGS